MPSNGYPYSDPLIPAIRPRGCRGWEPIRRRVVPVDRPVAVCYLAAMSQPVKLSDKLVLNARQVGGAVNRSIAGQIEHWAALGKIVEPFLEGHKTLALRQARNGQSLVQIFATIDAPEGKKRVSDYLEAQPYPHFEASAKPGILVRIDADGKRTLGRFIRKKFHPSAKRRSE